MDVVFGLIDNILKDRYEEDFIDRINYQVTPIVLGACASVLFAKVYLGLSIQCFTKAQFSSTWNAYSHDYCLIENTYYIPQETSIPHTSQRSEAQIAYYQWTGFILAGLALFFIVPHVMWRSFNWISGYHIRPIIKECYDAKDDPKKRSEAVERSARLLHEANKITHTYFHMFKK
uniref:Innexin n=1 Tax=Steinernema glaseri TaxID=37863 RepID=A0A1I8AP76_9BILA